MAGDLTQQKAMHERVNELSDGKMIALAVGICQLLDAYSDTSLNAQHLSFFPTTAMQSVKWLEQMLTECKDEWKWEPGCLKFASIGAPKK